MPIPLSSRVLEIDPQAATPKQLEVFERVAKGRGRVPTPYHVWLHCPEIADGMEIIGTYLDTGASLSEFEREIAILSTAAFWQSSYVLENHARHSRTAGVPEDAIAAMRSGLKPQFENSRAQLVADIVWAGLERRNLSDQEFAHAEQILTRRGIAELLALMGYFTSVSLGLKLHDLKPRAAGFAVTDN